ncbi:hypothetical protein [Aquipseudomonas alcaligenes]|uniref:hypothetical protein n=1 Tax=Aquipseudomonas alcaligenes TaxID=43263 RepID=UPI00374A2205
MPRIDIMSMVGSAVPQPLRAEGHIACWYVVVDGVPQQGPFVSRDLARMASQRCQREFRLH